MAQVPQDEWNRVYRELTQRLPSRSPLRHLGEGAVDTWAGMTLNVDGNQHIQIVKLLAAYGHPPTLDLLREIASADPVKYPDRQDDAKLAQAILSENVVVSTTTRQPEPAPMAPTWTFVPDPAPAAAPLSNSKGAVIGRAYDALEELLAVDALSEAEKAPLTALINVLQTKTGE